MMNRLLYTDEVNYASELSKVTLIKKVEDLFQKHTLSLAGELTSDNDFRAYDHQVVIGWDLPNLKRKSACLKGIITEGEKGALINLKVKPNSVYHFFALIATLAGLILALMALSNEANSILSLILGSVFLASGCIYFAVGTVFRNRLRNRLVKYLDLRKV